MSEYLKYRWRWGAGVLSAVLLGIPWYWPDDSFGLGYWLVPGWVWVTLTSAVLFSALVVWGALLGWPPEK